MTEGNIQEHDDKFEEVTFLIPAKPVFVSEESLQEAPQPRWEKQAVLLSQSNRFRIENNSIGGLLWEYWHHTEQELSFNDWLTNQWDEKNQKFSIP